MHEYSVVEALLDQCESEARKIGAEKIVKIVVKIGRLSGVVPELFESAYSVFSEDSKARGAALEIRRQNVVAECGGCGHTEELDELDFVCQKCGGKEMRVLDGDSIILMSLEME
ncbi:putative hydrogenase nickel incorporation protein HypA [Campylobacterota bacterium]|nr:putative hydrogenase nickel incorporation protein HypA [Campylobacterota bacterium]